MAFSSSSIPDQRLIFAVLVQTRPRLSNPLISLPPCPIASEQLLYAFVKLYPSLISYRRSAKRIPTQLISKLPLSVSSAAGTTNASQTPKHTPHSTIRSHIAYDKDLFQIVYGDITVFVLYAYFSGISHTLFTISRG